MRPKLVFMILLCALLVASIGCARNTAATVGESGEATEEIAPGMPLAPDFRIADIPLPAGFDFVRKGSFVFQNSRMDVGRIQYSGRAPIEEVAQFYLDEMTNYNWTLLNVTEYGSITLYFEKPDKAAQVLLTPKVRGTEIQISFFPKGSTTEPEF